MTPEEHLTVPYILVLESVRQSDGEWVRRASYPELGLSREAFSPLEAIDRLEEARVETILQKLAAGEPVPVPRPALRKQPGDLEQERLDFARWLVQEKRVRDS